MADLDQFTLAQLSALLKQVERGLADVNVSEVWRVYRWQHVEPNLEAKKQADWCWQNLVQHFGDLSVRQVDQIVVNAYVARRLTGEIGNPSRSVSARRELSYLRAALRYGCGPHARLYSKALLPEFELPKGSPPRERWLTVPEFERLLVAARSMRRGHKLSKLERFIWLGIETAGRKQALLELTWAQVDFEAGIVHLDVPGRVRTHKRRASVPMSRNLRHVLERAYRERENHLVLGNSNDQIWRSVQIAAIKAGFSDQPIVRGQKPKSTGITPHAFRRSAATLMARNGVSFYIIGLMLGISAATAEKHYAKFAPIPSAQSTDLITGPRLAVTENALDWYLLT